MKRKKIWFFIILLISLCNIVFAKDFGEVIYSFLREILKPIFYLGFAMAFIGLLYTLMMMTFKATSPEEQAKWRRGVLFSLIVMTVLIGVYGIIGVARETLGLDDIALGQVGVGEHNPLDPVP